MIINNEKSSNNYSPRSSWFLRGIEESVEIENSSFFTELFEKINYYPVEEIYLPSQIRYLAYVPKSKFFYFTTYDHPDLIKAQTVCHINSTDPARKEKTQMGSMVFETRDFINLRVPGGYKIVSLLASNSYLYILTVKEDCTDQLYLFKADVDKDRAFQFSSLTDPFIIDVDYEPELKALIADNGRNQYLFLYNFSGGNIYCGPLSELQYLRKNLTAPKVINPELVDKLTRFLAGAAVLLHYQEEIQGDPDYLHFLIADKNTNRVHEYHYSTVKNKDSRIFQDIIKTRNYNLGPISALSSVSVNLQNLSNVFKTKIDKVHFQILVTRSPNVFWTLDRHEDLGIKVLPLLGKYAQSTKRRGNMLNQEVPEIEDICRVEQQMMIFGSKDSDDWRVLLFPQNDWFDPSKAGSSSALKTKKRTRPDKPNKEIYNSP